MTSRVAAWRQTAETWLSAPRRQSAGDRMRNSGGSRRYGCVAAAESSTCAARIDMKAAMAVAYQT
jgi:hypothetical protein